MRKDKQLFRELERQQLEWVVEGLDLLLDKQLAKDQSVLDVRPIYLLKRKAQEEIQAKVAAEKFDNDEKRKIIREMIADQSPRFLLHENADT